MDKHIALAQADSLAGEAILEKLAKSGHRSDSLILLDRDDRVGKRLPYGAGYIAVQDQCAFDLSESALLLMPAIDTELETAALQQGCLLLSHAIDSDIELTVIDSALPEPEIGYTESSLRLPGPELACLLPTLLGLHRLREIRHLGVTLLRSAEFHGQVGVDELASQTIALLNSRDIKPSVFPQQIAFNMIPQTAPAELARDLRQYLGNNSYSSAIQTLNLPVFHGFAAAVQLEFASKIALEDCENLLASLPDVTLKNSPVSPISDCNQSFSCVISHLEQASDHSSSLQFWMIADPMRYGLANNYVNVTEFLLKSFL